MTLLPSPIARGVLRNIVLPVLMRGLHRVEFLAVPPLEQERPLLIVANHVSWWDGFLIHELAQRIRPRAPLFTVMLQRELERRPLLAAVGAVGVAPGSVGGARRMLRSLRSARQRHPNLIVQFYPQGRIFPSRRRPLGFRDGVHLVADSLTNPVVLPVAIHLEPMNHYRPTAFVACAAPVSWTEHPLGAADLERRITHTLDLLLSELDGAGETWRSPDDTRS